VPFRGAGCKRTVTLSIKSNPFLKKEKLLLAGGQWGASISLSGKPSSTDSCSLLSTEPITAKELEEALPDDSLDEQSPGKKRGRKAKATTPIVDSAVRRSPRVRANNNGFKANTCKAKNYLGCNADLPTLSTCTLRRIGTSLCNLQEEHLDDQVLLNKKKMEPVGKK
jgi:hypothetical protein